jgi:hypothetical protein
MLAPRGDLRLQVVEYFIDGLRGARPLVASKRLARLGFERALDSTMLHGRVGAATDVNQCRAARGKSAKRSARKLTPAVRGFVSEKGRFVALTERPLCGALTLLSSTPTKSGLEDVSGDL